MAVECNQSQSIFLTALAQTVKPVCGYLGIKTLEDMGATLGGAVGQTVAAIINGSRPSLTQAQGQCFCAFLDREERTSLEHKNYIRAIFNSQLPAVDSKEPFEGTWLDIWFRFFPVPIQTPINIDQLNFASPSYQVVLDLFLLAEPGILEALRPMTDGMIQCNDFCRRWKQSGHSHYDVSLRSVEALDYYKEIYATVQTALASLQNAGVLEVCGDPEHDPGAPDEAFLQGIRLLSAYQPVMVMTNRQELAKAVQAYRRKNQLPWSLRVVRYENGCFMDWPELLQVDVKLKVPAQSAKQGFTYQTKNWAAEMGKMFLGTDSGENDPV